MCRTKQNIFRLKGIKAKAYCLIVSLSLLSACSSTVDVKTSYSEEAKTVASLMTQEKVSSEDAYLLYKTWSGMTDYVWNTNKVKNTGEVIDALRAIQDEYKYVRGKYPESQKAIIGIMKKYEDSYVFVDEVKDDGKEITKKQFIDDMKRVVSIFECYINAN